ncbi:hypothetical protein BaRGS_00033348, partial [Batillaria attramentaria]
MENSYEKLKRKCLVTGTLFQDKEFPASNQSLFMRPPWSSYLTEWKRPRDIVKDPKFIVAKSLYMDFEQGELGNCWFVAAAASLAARDWKLLNHVVPHDQSFKEGEYAGIFRFNFWQYGTWKEVIIDDCLPTRNGKLIFTANTKQDNEFWVALLEKAYAKLYGSYEAIDGGRIHDALLDLTGGIAELIKVKTASTQKTDRRPPRLSQHAHHHGRRHLREWNGPWSDKSEEWSALSPSERTDQAFNKRDDGEFWISISDFKENFDELEFCHLSPESMTPVIAVTPQPYVWKREDFTGRWIRGVSAGGPLKSFTSRLFWSNPQYRVKIEGDENKEKCSVVISLLEYTNRLEKNDADISIGFVVFKLKPGKEPPPHVRLTAENYYEHTPQLVDTSGVFWPYRERSMHFLLEPGSYVVVPCTYRPNQESEFYLRIFSELPATAEFTEEPLGPSEDIGPPTEDMIERLFHRYSGADGKVDAFGLQKIVTEAKLQEFGKSEGYSLETCRALLSLNDYRQPFVRGLIDLEKVRKVWSYIQMWTTAFHTADVSEDNTVDAFELKEMFKKI